MDSLIDRRKPGEVRDAITTFLRNKGGDASLMEIQGAVAGELERPAAPSSVRSYLRLNTPQIFRRTGAGRYALAGLETELPFPRQARPFEPVFTFGNARFFQADCLDWLDSQPESSLHAVVTDPPYGLVEYSAHEQRKLRSGTGGVWRIPPSFDGHQRSPLPRFTVLTPGDHEALVVFFSRWARKLLRVLVPGAHVLVASNPLLSHLVSNALATAGLECRGEIVRLVMTMRGGDRPKNAHMEFPSVSVMPRSMWEPWLLFRKPLEGRVQDNLRTWGTGGLRRPCGERPFGDVIKSHPTGRNERQLAPHPSLKPQSFLRQVVRAILPLGRGVVLDPFAGSGSTLAAAEAVGYVSIGVEMDPHFVNMARDAIPKLAGMAIRKSSRRRLNGS